MPADSILKFTDDPAVKLWAKDSGEGKQLILSNVWCSSDRRGVTTTNYTGSIAAGVPEQSRIFCQVLGERHAGLLAHLPAEERNPAQNETAQAHGLT